LEAEELTLCEDEFFPNSLSGRASDREVKSRVDAEAESSSDEEEDETALSDLDFDLAATLGGLCTFGSRLGMLTGSLTPTVTKLEVDQRGMHVGQLCLQGWHPVLSFILPFIAG